MLSRLGQALAAAPPGQYGFTLGVLALAAVVCFVLGFRRLREARLLQDTPTSRIRSAAQGYVELVGFARLLPGPDIVSPLTRRRCAWWRYRIEHRETWYDGNRRRSEWRLLEQATSEELFVLADDSGDCIVDPQGAQVWPSLRRRWQGGTPRPLEVPAKTPWFSFGSYRYHEELICVGDPLYGLGWFRSQSATQSPDEAAEVRELLREWKREPRELLRRFDADGDGRLDVGEWDRARAAAVAEVRTEQLRQSLQPELHVLCRPPDGRRFLLSTLMQKQLVGGLRRAAAALVLVSLACGGTAAWLLAARVG